MDLLLGFGLLAAFAVVFAIGIHRSVELFVLDVRRGRATFVRGRIPQRLLDDINDVLARSAVEHARIRVVREDGRPRVLVRGQVGDGPAQRLRNVVGMYDIAKIRAGGRRR